jgi:hypothetical protein
LYSYFVARKAVGLRHRANYGISRVSELSALPDDQIPQHVKQAFAPFAEVCRTYQMQPVRCIRSPCIGNRTVFSSMWLDPAGKTNCSITWIDVRLGALRKTKTLFACHSWLQSGTELHTGAIAPTEWIPELVPPNREMLPLAEDTPTSVAIDRHQERIAGRSDVRSFDVDSLMLEILRDSQELFDYFVARGFYMPLSEAEINRLRS